MSTRRDKFYLKSKKYQFKSRAAFKLIEIDESFRIIRNARCIVDLCSYPGSWIQVVQKKCIKNANIIGIDLQPQDQMSKSRFFQGDITSFKTLVCLKFFIKTHSLGADLILNDGAPRVGTDWAKDLYRQTEISLNAAKIAIHCLVKEGNFVTKIFRSKFTNGIVFLLKKFFRSVIIFKPKSSRQSSAEVFIICQVFYTKVRYDNRIFYPNWIFSGGQRPNLVEEYKKKKKRYEVKFMANVLEYIRNKDNVVRSQLNLEPFNNEIESTIGIFFFSPIRRNSNKLKKNECSFSLILERFCHIIMFLYINIGNGFNRLPIVQE